MSLDTVPASPDEQPETPPRQPGPDPRSAGAAPTDYEWAIASRVLDRLYGIRRDNRARMRSGHPPLPATLRPIEISAFCACFDHVRTLAGRAIFGDPSGETDPPKGGQPQ